MRKSVVLWLSMAALCSGLLFQTSQRVNDGRTKLAGIEAETKKEEEHIRVLEAEWSYLNQPDRLEKLSRQYLHLAPLKGKQFAKLEDIPARPAPEVAPAPATATPQADIEPAPALVTDEVEAQEPVTAQDETVTEKPAAATAAKPVTPAKPTAAVAPQKWQPVVKAQPQTGLIWRAPPPPAARRKDFVWSAPPPRLAPRSPTAPAPAYTPQKPQAQPPQQRRSFGELMKSLGVQ